MNKEREAYYRLSELFAVLVPKALRGFLQSKMKASERVRGYAHSLAWWEDNKGKLPRASLTGGELHVLDPENWEMNMLLKVIKYSDFDLLERYEEEWSALDDLIEARRIVFGNTAGKKVSPHDADECFRIVSDALGILGQVGEMENVKTIKKKPVTKEEGESFQEALKMQDAEWQAFVNKLYERGMPPMPEQLEGFESSKKGKINVYEEMAIKYNSFGPRMLHDRAGNKVAAIKKAQANDPVDITKEIVRRWLAKEGGVTPTWDELVQCLRHAQLNVLAEDIEKSLI